MKIEFKERTKYLIYNPEDDSYQVVQYKATYYTNDSVIYMMSVLVSGKTIEDLFSKMYWNFQEFQAVRRADNPRHSFTTCDYFINTEKFSNVRANNFSHKDFILVGECFNSPYAYRFRSSHNSIFRPAKASERFSIVPNDRSNIFL